MSFRRAAKWHGRSRWQGVVAVLAAGVLAMLALRQRSRPHSPPPPQRGRAAGPVRSTRATPSVAAQPAASARFPAPRRTDKGPAPGGAGQVVRSWDVLTERWEKEEENGDWTESVVTYFAGLLDMTDGGGELLRAVACKQSLCRVQLSWDRVPALQRAEPALGADGYGLTYRILPSDGGATVAAFIFRLRPEEESP